MLSPTCFLALPVTASPYAVTLVEERLPASKWPVHRPDNTRDYGM